MELFIKKKKKNQPGSPEEWYGLKTTVSEYYLTTWILPLTIPRNRGPYIYPVKGSIFTTHSPLRLHRFPHRGPHRWRLVRIKANPWVMESLVSFWCHTKKSALQLEPISDGNLLQCMSTNTISGFFEQEHEHWGVGLQTHRPQHAPYNARNRSLCCRHRLCSRALATYFCFSSILKKCSCWSRRGLSVSIPARRINQTVASPSLTETRLSSHQTLSPPSSVFACNTQPPFILTDILGTALSR